MPRKKHHIAETSAQANQEMDQISRWVRELELLPHPEGGWYKEVYRAEESIAPEGLPERFDGPRSFCTSIYFLLAGDNVSTFHRIKSDELWHFYAGDGLTVHIIAADGEYNALQLGNGPGETFQGMVPAGSWFGAEPKDSGYALVGCTVAPGFDFADFELAERSRLTSEFPQHRELIERLTRS